MTRTGSFLRPSYIWIAVGRVGSTVQSIEQRLVLASNDKRAKLALLETALLQTAGRTLVFVRTKSLARWLTKQLREARLGGGIVTCATAIHGDRSQSQRESALREFTSGRALVLVATDVAARGLDVDNVTHVVQFDLPSGSDFDSYVHRIGRTGRAGSRGLATGECIFMYRYISCESC